MIFVCAGIPIYILVAFPKICGVFPSAELFRAQFVFLLCGAGIITGFSIPKYISKATREERVHFGVKVLKSSAFLFVMANLPFPRARCISDNIANANMDSLTRMGQSVNVFREEHGRFPDWKLTGASFPTFSLADSKGQGFEHDIFLKCVHAKTRYYIPLFPSLILKLKCVNSYKPVMYYLISPEEWIMCAPGPDRDYQIDLGALQNGSYKHQIYDPTNGFASCGDIVIDSHDPRVSSQ